MGLSKQMKFSLMFQNNLSLENIMEFLGNIKNTSTVKSVGGIFYTDTVIHD